MRRSLIRPLTVGVAAVLVAAAVSGGALAAGAARHVGRVGGARAQGIPLGFGLGNGGPGGPGLGVPVPASGFPGPMAGLVPGPLGGLGPGRLAGAGILGADILDPAASYLGIGLSTLESDLAGGKSLADVANATTGKSSADLISAIVANEKTILDADAAAGWITAAQETALVNAFTVEVTALVNNGPPVPPAAPVTPAGGLLQTAASFLNISLSTLESDLQSGKTLADVATAQGDTVSALVTALEAPAKSKLDAAVSAGKITSTQETAILNEMTTRLTNIVNGTLPNKTLRAVRVRLAAVAGLDRVIRTA